MTTAAFIDSSALVRLLFDEGDNTAVYQALTDGSATSEITEVEVPVAINRRHLLGELNDDRHAELLQSAAELLEGMARIAVTADVRSMAVELSQTAIIRTFDAIQVASAIVAGHASRRHGNSFSFLTADSRQANVARASLGARRTVLLDPL